MTEQMAKIQPATQSSEINLLITCYLACVSKQYILTEQISKSPTLNIDLVLGLIVHIILH